MKTSSQGTPYQNVGQPRRNATASVWSSGETRSDQRKGCTNVVASEVVDFSMGQHSVVFEFGLLERRSVGGNLEGG